MRRFTLALACCACTELPTEVGDHVVYHWDASEERLCGGTVGTVDRFVEAMAGYYGWRPSDSGPEFEYFWDAALANSACSWADNLACVTRILNGPIVFADTPIDTHELAHTARGGLGHPGLGYPVFINEAFASRWQSTLLEYGTVYATAPGFLSAAQLQTALEANDSSDVDYASAFTWWVALETSFGPETMATFIMELDGATSADDVELAMGRVFGISLAESAVLAQSLPAAKIDDPACEFEGLPTFAWNEAPLVLDRGRAHCEDDDVVNLGGRAVIWLFALEFPGTPTGVDVSVTVPVGEDPQQKGLHMVWCNGELDVDEPSPRYNAGADHPGAHGGLWYLSGRYVGTVAGVIEADGAVVFPRVIFDQTQP